MFFEEECYILLVEIVFKDIDGGVFFVFELKGEVNFKSLIFCFFGGFVLGIV